MFRRISFPIPAFLCVALLFWAALPASGQVMSIRSEVRHDVSTAVRDMPTNTGPEVTREAEEIRSIPLPAGLKTPGDPDPVLQQAPTRAPSLLAPGVNLGFDGIGQGVFGFNVGVAPPDTNGAVGLSQYVQWVNLSFAVFDKSNGSLIKGPVAGNSLWQGFGGSCETNNDGDPIVTYDKLANRWVFTQFVVRGPTGGFGPFFQCVAVSTTSDATGTFNRYAFQYSNFDDYPKMGVWPDAYYVTFNMFDPTGSAFVGADACAYDRNAMLNGQAATQVCFQQGSSVGGLLPSDVDGSQPPPPGSPNYMLFFGGNSLNLFKFHVDFATPSNSTFIGPANIPVAAFTPLCNGGRSCVPQAGTATRLDSLADRLMYRLAYRNFGSHESLVVNHSVAAGSGGGIRWYEVQNPNSTPVVAQQGTFAPDSNFRWMGSIAMDQSGDLAVGYSLSGSGMFPSIAFTGRTPSDPANTLEAETLVIGGSGAQSGLTRWGDYSALQVDPVDDCTFWYTTEYLKTSGSFNWNTFISSFKFPNCGVDSTVTVGFDPDFYLSLYPDLRAAFGNNHQAALNHWLNYGASEGRRPSRQFDPVFYLNFYPDLLAAFGPGNYLAAYNHWLTYGLNEGRRGSREFDVAEYLRIYPDLSAAFGANFAAALSHWVRTGIHEGRRTSREFDVAFYLNSYPDLLAAFGAGNFPAAFDHWIANGINEGRRSAFEFDVNFYLNHYPDLLAAFGAGNFPAAYSHFIANGLNEGRASSVNFDVGFYLHHYPDLVAAFGSTNYPAAFDHWITYGRNEGRQGAP